MEERYQIGSITSGYRVIRPGEEYDKYFPGDGRNRTRGHKLYLS